MKIIKQLSLIDLKRIYNKIKEIKENLKENQELIITLDTETTGKYYNKFQIENTGIEIVDKIIEFGAIFSIKNIDYYGFETIIPIKDDLFNENPDLGFRLFFNPFIDNHKPFHITMPKEPYEIHNISLEFLEGKTSMTFSNEKLEEPAPSLLENKIIENEETSYIKEIMKIINTCNILIAHNATFDVGMINEAVNDYNKLNENKISFINCKILDTLKLFKEEFPKELLISMQEEKTPKEINHKLDNMMFIAGIEERDVHGAYWDSKLLIDSYSIILEKYITKKFMKNIVIKQTEYLSKLNYIYKEKSILSIKEKIEILFFEKLHDNDFLDIEKIKNHLKLQLTNINKQKRNLITEEQIDNSVLYYFAFLELNKEIDSINKFEEKLEKITSKSFDKMIKDIKDSKTLNNNEISNLQKIDMSHYLTQAIYYYFKFQFEKQIELPLIEETFILLNEIIDSKKNIEIELEKDYIYTYFRTDGSIATKDNSLTTIIGSISNVKKYFESCNMNKVICMDFNSMVNYINVGKYLKAYNENNENKIELNYGLTTLLKLYLNDEIKSKYNLDVDFIDFEVNIICKNDDGIKMIPIILKQAYSDKFENENSYKDPYLSLEQFRELNKNENLCLTLGSYKGLIERILFDFSFYNKKDLIDDLLDIIEDKINIEIYPSDPFLLEYKENFVNKVNYIFTNPSLYLKDDYEAHLIRCHKYNDNIYQLNNYRIFNNFKLKIIN